MSTILAIAQQYPAIALVACIVLALLLARIAAYFTTRKVSDNGLIYEYQKQAKNR